MLNLKTRVEILNLLNLKKKIGRFIESTERVHLDSTVGERIFPLTRGLLTGHSTTNGCALRKTRTACKYNIATMFQ